MDKTSSLVQLWQEGRTRLTQILPKIVEGDVNKRLHPESNSIGFLLRHIAEVEYLFTKNVFGQNIEVKVYTIGVSNDKGLFNNLAELISYLSEAEQTLKKVFEAQSNENWEESITTKEFGTKTKQEALARILTHTTYHAGQIAIILKYGKIYNS